MITAFQVVLLIVIFLSIASIISKDLKQDDKKLATALGIVAIVGFVVTILFM